MTPLEIIMGFVLIGSAVFATVMVMLYARNSNATTSVPLAPAGPPAPVPAPGWKPGDVHPDPDARFGTHAPDLPTPETSLGSLNPDFRKMVVDWMIACNERLRIQLYVLETGRHQTRQILLKDAGYSRTLNSRHLRGEGIDVWPAVNGEIIPFSNPPEAIGLLTRCAHIAKEFGLRNLASIGDHVHFQESN